ncbi:DUF4136 domain-containing protein [Granulicella tundricola]|uniref:DUF4136 domain-containing protein n=1 Tax=Granulicella tundricola (strain ATCC BAA-1859 / DSM 23138 / MP5ACTX9) TaxID=1198114 RepID=E8WYB4_GRATM|nr:DUF4136 domain-containing protein [Granulicella tundricola]ADW69820.1 hypothetical protein AciX9_2797 [Granulicella tundricola MP5ACTX9]
MFSIKTVRMAALGCVMGCAAAAFAADVSTDYDHNANFRSYKTFSFYKVQSSDPFFDTRIQAEVTKDLAQAGWTMVPSGGDVMITAVENSKDEKQYNTFYDGLGGGGFGWGGWGGWGGGRWGGPGYSSTSVEKITVGTLMMDMYDAHTHQLIWRGKADSQLSNKGDKNTKKLDKDIDHMLNGFPPKTQG